MASDFMESIENRTYTPIPKQILDALGAVQPIYSSIEAVIFCSQVSADCWVGVTGGVGYEYFIMLNGAFTCSDQGYARDTVALRELLNHPNVRDL